MNDKEQLIFWEIDDEFTFKFISTEVKNSSGYEPTGVIGHSILDFVAPESKESYRNILESSKCDIKGKRDIKVKIIDNNGRIKVISNSFKPVLECGKFLGYRGMSIDVNPVTKCTPCIKCENCNVKIKLKKAITVANATLSLLGS